MFQTFDVPEGSGSTRQRVDDLRALLQAAKLDALLIPRADEHQGEYVPPSAERLKWISGFSGSAGLVLVGRKRAVLFTDGRYTVQAAAEVDGEIFEISMLARPRLAEWIVDALPKGAVIGFDPKLHTISEIERMDAKLGERGIRLKPTPKNLIDKLRVKELPLPPNAPVRVHSIEYAGRLAADKIADIQKRLAEDRQDAAVLTLTDSVAWAFNIRGADVPHNPVVLAFAIIPRTGKAELFVDPAKAGKDVRSHLAGVAKLAAIDTLEDRLKALKAAKRRVRIDPDTAGFWFERVLGRALIARGADPCIALKAIKNETEIAGARAAHVRDGAAVVRFLAWLDEAAADGALDEITAVKTLEDFRRDTTVLREISFPTISGSGPNGAIVHYRVTDATNRRLKPGELFLIDSGAQYEDGTTDITRTIAIGAPAAEMRARFTRVLKGHIAVATARFPAGTRGIDLDPFARRALWDAGLDFDHGTGHGIGSYLAVHEGPQSISRGGMAVLKPGMLISNEPGFYKAGAYGIRIENVVLVTEAQAITGGERPMMAFETLTLAPFDRRLIDLDLLSEAERNWVNAYHAEVRSRLQGFLDRPTLSWLKKATAPL